MKYRNLLFALPLTAMSFTALAANESTSQGYVGLSLGQMEVDDFCMGGEISCDDSPVGVRVFYGGQFTNIFGAEIGYQHMEDADREAVISGIFVDETYSGHFLDTTLTASFPPGELIQAYAKVGLQAWRLDYTGTARSGFNAIFVDESESGLSLKGGLGLKFRVAEPVSIRLDWDLLKDIGDKDTVGEADLSVLSLGFGYHF